VGVPWNSSRLGFIITIDHVDLIQDSGSTYFDMHTLTAHLDVEPLP